MQLVLDTNVLDAGLRSRRGASFQILSMIGGSAFETNLSVPLALEYEAVLLRHKEILGLTSAQVFGFVDYICSVSNLHEIYYLWRPLLRDPSDEMIAELAVKAGARFVISHNIKDFGGLTDRFAIEVITPGALLQIFRQENPKTSS